MKLKEIKEKINQFRKIKYQNLIFSKKTLNLRKSTIRYILKLKESSKIYRNHGTNNFFNKNLNKKNVITYYKKFSTNLILKKKYNTLNFKKKTNQNACFYSYILLSKLIINEKRINNIQKLNFFLKINDLLIFLFDKKKHEKYIKDFKQNIYYEQKLIKELI